MTDGRAADHQRRALDFGFRLVQRFVEPGDVANAVVFLASDLSRFLTGESINATGGVLMD